MKIPELPQVEFDEFPSDETTKLCIFTKPRYPVPDLSKMFENGQKVSLFCTESTILTLGRFKQIPQDLFKTCLPNGKTWLTIDSSLVDGLETPFGVTCLPIGNPSGSVMLLIFINDTQQPKRLILYTGSFRECSEVFMNDMFLKYKPKIEDLYIDNTLASSTHLDAIQNAQACNTINEIVDHFKHHKILLEVGMFESLDFLVDLVRRHHLHVKLDLIQQVFFYKSPYKHLFEYDSQINNANELNKHFQFKGRPMVYVVPPKEPFEVKDLHTYKRNYLEQNIISIRLISCKVDPWRAQYNGLIYVSYFSHAGAFTLSQLIHETQPKRIHPTVNFEICNDSMSRIPYNILNKGCEIVNSLDVQQLVDVTLDDIDNCKETLETFAKKRSFLDPSTYIDGETMLHYDEDIPNSMSNFILSDEIINISDDESITMDAMCGITRRKRSSDSNDSPRDSINNNITGKKPKVNVVSTSQSIGSGELECGSSSDSECRVIFPDSYD